MAIARVVKMEEKDDPDNPDNVIVRVYWEILPPTGDVNIDEASYGKPLEAAAVLEDVAGRASIEWV